MILIQKKGPPGQDGSIGQLGGIDIAGGSIAGLTEGDIIAFRYEGGQMVPFRLARHESHRLTLCENDDYIDLNIP